MANAYSLPFEAPYVGLPVGQIAQVASQINEQRMAGDDLLDNVFYEMEQTQVAPQDREGFLRLKEDLKRRMMEVADRGFGYDRLRSIRRMAREAARDISFLQGNYAALQKNLQEIEADTTHSREVRDAYKAQAIANYRGAFTEDGRIDTTRSYSPVTFAKAADIGKILQDAAKEFRRDFQDFEFKDGYIVTTKGEIIDPDELGTYFLSRLRNNPEAQAYLSDLRSVLGDEWVSELVRENITQAVLAKANPNVQRSLSSDPYAMARFNDRLIRSRMVFGDQLERQRKADEEAGKSGYYMLPGRGRNFAEGAADLERRIREAPEGAARDKLQVLYDGMLRRYTEQAGVSPEDLQSFLSDRKARSVSSVIPGNLRFMPGFNAPSTVESPLLREKRLRAKYGARYDQLKKAAEGFDKFVKEEGVRDYTIVPTAETDEDFKNYWENVLSTRMDLYTTGNEKLDKRVRDAQANGLVRPIGLSYSEAFGREIELEYRKDKNSLPEVVRLRVKDTGQAGEMGKDAIDYGFRLLGADEVVEETQLDYLEVGKDWTGDETFQLRLGENGIKPGVRTESGTEDVTGRLFVNKLREIKEATGASREKIIETFALPFLPEISQSTGLPAGMILSYLRGELGEGDAARVQRALSSELSLPKSKALPLSQLMNQSF